MPLDKRYIVLDTWVLEKASSQAQTDIESAEFFKSIELLSRIYNKCHRIILDYDGEIEKEYEKHAKDFSKRWLVRMSILQDKIKFRGRASMKINMDPDDKKFIEVAVNSPDRIVISGDSDFFDDEFKKQIKDKRLKIFTVDEALVELS